jgi:hypothetical protein
MTVLVKNGRAASLFNISDIARAVGRPISSMYRAVRVGKTVPAPKLKVGRRYYYPEAEYRSIVGLLGGGSK